MRAILNAEKSRKKATKSFLAQGINSSDCKAIFALQFSIFQDIKLIP